MFHDVVDSSSSPFLLSFVSYILPRGFIDASAGCPCPGLGDDCGGIVGGVARVLKKTPRSFLVEQCGVFGEVA